jgi:peroxiredoxin
MILSLRVRRAIARPILLATVAVIGGLPAYFFFDHLHFFPVSLRDRPWPVEAVVLAATLSTALLARASRGAERRVALACAALGTASLAGLVIVAHVARFALGAPAREIALSKALPPATLLDEQGRPVELTELRGRPMLLVVYRGGWCPSCRAQLTALLPEVDRFLSAGVRVVGISPDPPEVSLRWSRELGLPFPLLSDPSERIGPDLCGGSAHCELIVDERGAIRWGALSDNWRLNPPASTILQAVYRLR